MVRLAAFCSLLFLGLAFGASPLLHAQDHDDLHEEAWIEMMVFDRMPLNDVLREFSQMFELNIVLGRGITGEVTLSLTNVPMMEALVAILRSQGLDYERIESQAGQDLLLIVPYQAPTPNMVVAHLSVEPPMYRVEFDFDKLVASIATIVADGQVVSFEESWLVMIQGPPEQVDLARRFVALAMENLPERYLDEEEEPEPVEEEPEYREVARRELFVLDPEPEFFEQALIDLTRLLGHRPEVINEHLGIIVFQDVEVNLELVAKYVAAVSEPEPEAAPAVEPPPTSRGCAATTATGAGTTFLLLLAALALLALPRRNWRRHNHAACTG